MVGLIVMRGGGYGALRDIIVGIVAAFIGGIVMSFLGVHGQAGFSAASSSRSFFPEGIGEVETRRIGDAIRAVLATRDPARCNIQD